MKLLALVFLLSSPSFALIKHRRTVTAAEQANRLVPLPNQAAIVSPACEVPSVKVIADVSESGAVTDVHPFKSRVSTTGDQKGALKRLFEEAKQLVSRFRYRPLLVGGKPKPARAVVEIPCLSPQEGQPQP